MRAAHSNSSLVPSGLATEAQVIPSDPTITVRVESCAAALPIVRGVIKPDQ
jgi:hypothetical protein